MAIVYSHTVWNSRKSAGGVTYRHSRGRTIMSQKRMKGTPTRADGQVMTYREAIFAVINAAAKVLAVSIGVSFEKTKYGSRRNDFFKKNYQYFEELAQAPLSEESTTFANTLKSFGMQTGQTIVAALQAGIIDTSGLEMAMLASKDGANYGFLAFGIWSENTTTSAKYIRSDINGQLIVAGATEVWSRTNDPLIDPIVTSFIGITSGTGQNMQLMSFEVRGRNLESLALLPAIIKSGSGQPVAGTWSEDGRTFTKTTGTTIPQGEQWSYVLEYNGERVASTTIYGSGISGE